MKTGSIGIGENNKGETILRFGDGSYYSTGSPKTNLHVISDSSHASPTGGLIFKRRSNNRMHLTAFGVGGLAFLAGFGICWFVFVR